VNDYIETLRQQWGESCDGSTWEKFLERKLAAAREGLHYWSYCTDIGMRQSCPEKIEELSDLMISFGIAPYSMRRW